MGTGIQGLFSSSQQAWRPPGGELPRLSARGETDHICYFEQLLTTVDSIFPRGTDTLLGVVSVQGSALGHFLVPFHDSLRD